MRYTIEQNRKLFEKANRVTLVKALIKSYLTIVRCFFLKVKIKVVDSMQADASTNCENTINILNPIYSERMQGLTNEELAIFILGLVVHELFHMFWTDLNYTKKEIERICTENDKYPNLSKFINMTSQSTFNVIFSMCNITEDAHINRKGKKNFPKFSNALNFVYKVYNRSLTPLKELVRSDGKFNRLGIFIEYVNQFAIRGMKPDLEGVPDDLKKICEGSRREIMDIVYEDDSRNRTDATLAMFERVLPQLVELSEKKDPQEDFEQQMNAKEEAQSALNNLSGEENSSSSQKNDEPTITPNEKLTRKERKKQEKKSKNDSQPEQSDSESEEAEDQNGQGENGSVEQKPEQSESSESSETDSQADTSESEEAEDQNGQGENGSAEQKTEQSESSESSQTDSQADTSESEKSDENGEGQSGKSDDDEQAEEESTEVEVQSMSREQKEQTDTEGADSESSSGSSTGEAEGTEEEEAENSDETSDEQSEKSESDSQGEETASSLSEETFGEAEYDDSEYDESDYEDEESDEGGSGASGQDSDYVQDERDNSEFLDSILDELRKESDGQLDFNSEEDHLSSIARHISAGTNYVRPNDSKVNKLEIKSSKGRTLTPSVRAEVKKYADKVSRMVANEVKTKTEDGYLMNQLGGHLSSSQAMNYAIRQNQDKYRIFEKTIEGEEGLSIAVQILIDESYSMEAQGCKNGKNAVAVAAILHETCRRLNIPVRVCSFTTRTYLYCDFDEPCTKTFESRLAEYEGHGSTDEAQALLLLEKSLFERPEHFKYLFLVSDGQPGFYVDKGTAEEWLKGYQQYAINKGIQFIACCTGNSKKEVGAIYDGPKIVYDDYNELAKRVTKELIKAIKY